MAPVTKKAKDTQAKGLAQQLKGVAGAAKSLGIDTRKAESMVKQTERQGSRSFAGSREEKAYLADIKANPIPVTGMQPQTPAILPPKPVPEPLPTGTAPTDLATYYGLATNTETTDTTATGAPGATGAPATDPFLQAMQMQKDLFETESPNAGKELARLERQYDINQKQADVTNLKGQLGAITSSAQQQTLALENQGRGIPTDILSTQAYEIQRRSAIAALPIAAQLDAAQGDLQMAQQRVDRLFQVRMADATAQYNFKSKVIDSIANYADKQETKRLEEVRYQQGLKLRKEEQNFGLVSDWAKTAFESGQSTLGGKIMALDPASPTFKTDFARLQGQVVKPVTTTSTQDWDIQGDYKINKRTGEVVPLSAATPGAQDTTNLDSKYTALLNDIGQARQMKDAVGAGWLERNVKNAISGNNKPAQLENITNTIKANLLTLNTDPAIKKFFGPQMSNRDTELMMGAAGTLNPVTQTPAEYEKDLQDAANLIVRAREAVRTGVQQEAPMSSLPMNVVLTPDGMEVVIID